MYSHHQYTLDNMTIEKLLEGKDYSAVYGSSKPIQPDWSEYTEMNVYEVEDGQQIEFNVYQIEMDGTAKWLASFSNADEAIEFVNDNL